MSKLRCHISISLDGYVGPNQSEENPLGEGGERLHDWVVPLAAWRQSHGEQGGEVNESARIVEESRENIGAAVMGRNMSALSAVVPGATSSRRAGGVTTRPTTTPCSSSPITRVIRWRWREGRRSTSSPTESSPRSNRPRRPPAPKTSCCGAAVTSSSSTWRRDYSTSSSCTSFRCCSVAVLASSTTSGTRIYDSSRSGPSRRPASPTSSTGSCRVLHHDRIRRGNSRFRCRMCIRARQARLCVSVSGTRKPCQTSQSGGNTASERRCGGPLRCRVPR